MTRLAAVLAATVLGSGCFTSGDGEGSPTSDSKGSVNLYWYFVRNAPAQPGGYVIYDDGLVGPGDTACPESGVEAVEVTSPSGTVWVSCIYAGVQGIAYDNVPEGNQSFRVRGWRYVDGGDRLLYDQRVFATVVAGRAIDVYVDAEPVVAEIDAVAFLNNVDTSDSVPNFTYATCDQAEYPRFAYDLYDSAGTLVDSVISVVCPPGASTLGLPIMVGRLDRDTYSIRVKGYTGVPQARTFDSCTSDELKFRDFHHFQDDIGAGAIELDLYTLPACTEP